MRGQDGSYDEEVDVGGNVVKQLGQIDPVPGKSLKLTIDKDLQLCMEKAVDEHLAYLRSSGLAPGARAAAIIAIDPKTGAVRAMVSRPAFNPNLFVHGISEKTGILLIMTLTILWAIKLSAANIRRVRRLKLLPALQRWSLAR